MGDENLVQLRLQLDAGFERPKKESVGLLTCLCALHHRVVPPGKPKLGWRWHPGAWHDLTIGMSTAHHRDTLTEAES